MRSNRSDSPSVSANSDLPDVEASRPAQPTYALPPSFPIDAQIYRQSGYHIAPNYSTKSDQIPLSGYTVPTTPDPAVINQMLQNPYFLQTSLPSHLMLNKANEKLFLDPNQQANPTASSRVQQQSVASPQPQWQVAQQANMSNTYSGQYSNNTSQTGNSNSPTRNQNNSTQSIPNNNGNGNSNGQYDTPQGMVEYSRFLMVR